MSISTSTEQHLSAFVDAFVVPARRERWKYLLARRRKGALRDSTRLMGHLDMRLSKQVDGNFELTLNTQGVFYDFYHEPRLISLEKAEDASRNQDAILSVIPGKLAVYWSHEGWSWLFRS